MVNKNNIKTNQSIHNMITIDGPAASGKTSVSRKLAKILDWQWISTGAFYRAVAFLVQKHQIHPLNEPSIVKLIHQNQSLRVTMQPHNTAIELEGCDISDKTLSEDIADIASQVSSLPKVRTLLLKPQRDCLQKIQKGLVAEGRDCGTVVFPQAPLKIYLTASLAHRKQRRILETGLTSSHQEKRDLRDQKRTIAPLKIAPDAHLIDTSDIDEDAVVEKILHLHSFDTSI